MSRPLRYIPPGGALVEVTHSARALTRDHLLRGWWFDRSREYAAWRRGETYGRYRCGALWVPATSVGTTLQGVDDDQRVVSPDSKPSSNKRGSQPMSW